MFSHSINSVSVGSDTMSEKKSVRYRPYQKSKDNKYPDENVTLLKNVERERKCLVDEKWITLTPSGNKKIVIGVSPLENFNVFLKIHSSNTPFQLSFNEESFLELMEKLPHVLEIVQKKSTETNLKILDLKDYDVLQVKYRNICFIQKGDDFNTTNKMVFVKETVEYVLLLKSYFIDLFHTYNQKQSNYYVPSFDSFCNDLAQKSFEKNVENWKKFIIEEITSTHFYDTDLLFDIFLKLNSTIEYEIKQKIKHMSDHNWDI